MAAQYRRRATWQTLRKDDIKLSQLLAEFLEYHEALNHSPKTVRWYSDIISAVYRFIGPDPCLGDLTLPRVRACQSHLRKRAKPNGEPLSDKTLQDHARVIRILSWAGSCARSTCRRSSLPASSSRRLAESNWRS